MTVEQGLRAEFHDRRKVLARALRAAREQFNLNSDYRHWQHAIDIRKTREGKSCWIAVYYDEPNAEQYLPSGYVDVEESHDAYLDWLERMIETTNAERTMEKEHWAFCNALKKYREIKTQTP